MATNSQITAVWQGPYGWPRHRSRNQLPRLPDDPGVYLQTYPYRGGRLIYTAGTTRRSARRRHLEHLRKYMCGDYTVLNCQVSEWKTYCGRRVESSGESSARNQVKSSAGG